MDNLEEKGRRKAQFIKNAVLYYLEQSDAEKAAAAPVEIREEQLERMFLSVIQKSPRIAAALRAGSGAQDTASPKPDTPHAVGRRRHGKRLNRNLPYAGDIQVGIGPETRKKSGDHGVNSKASALF